MSSNLVATLRVFFGESYFGLPIGLLLLQRSLPVDGQESFMKISTSKELEEPVSCCGSVLHPNLSMNLANLLEGATGELKLPSSACSDEDSI